MSTSRTDCRLAASKRRAVFPARFQNGLGTRVGPLTSFAGKGSATPLTETAPGRFASSKETDRAAPARIDLAPAACTNEVGASHQIERTAATTGADRESAKPTMRAGPLSRTKRREDRQPPIVPRPGGVFKRPVPILKSRARSKRFLSFSDVKTPLTACA